MKRYDLDKIRCCYALWRNGARDGRQRRAELVSLLLTHAEDLLALAERALDMVPRSPEDTLDMEAEERISPPIPEEEP